MSNSLNLLLASSSRVHPYEYLEYCSDEISDFFSSSNNIIFIPYARPGGISYDKYTDLANEGFKRAGKKVKGIHEYNSTADALNDADGVFTGGGNTFLLLKTLYENDVLNPLKKRIKDGLNYMGTSAGTNITGPSIKTTNDMPIVYPPSFNSLEAVNFNINPHYLDPNPNSTHKGETRETRINEYHFHNENLVVGLREGSILRIQGGKVRLIGEHSVRIFEKDKNAIEINDDDTLTKILL